MPAIAIPLAACADEAIGRLARATGVKALANVDGATLLGERAMLAGLPIPGRTSAGGGCRLLDAVGDTVALNLARPADRELLPALFETDHLDTDDDEAIAARIAKCDAAALVMRGRAMGMAIAAEHESPPSFASAYDELAVGAAAVAAPARAPRVLDLSALWAGPLAAHLLWLAGATVVKAESRERPDAMREGNRAFYALLNQGKASVVVDFTDASDRQALLSLIASFDIVIEASRPRALAQLGIDVARIVRTTPGLVWVSITAHGAQGEAAQWVGFGDDCGVAGGLSAALHAAGGRSGFVGDAIADPLTGIHAALAAWEAWKSRRGGRIGVTMTHVVARCLGEARSNDPKALKASLRAWSAAVGKPSPTVNRRPIGALPSFGEDTRTCLMTHRSI
jgi:hypothetical protein